MTIPTGAPRSPGRPFVGRAPEMELLETCLHAVAAGQGQFVTLVGEPGIGKTRTVEEFLGRARIPRARVLWGRCPEEEGVPAFWPWMQAIRCHVEHADADLLRDALGPATAEVARLVPAVRERLPDLEATPTSDPVQSRFRFFEGVATFLQRLAARDVHVLILDDLHWADDATLLLLGFVVPEIRRSRLLILCTYRDAEMRHAPRRLAQVMRADERVTLRGLDPEHIATLVEETTAAVVPATLVRQLHRVSGGNPYFLGELVRWLRTERALSAPELPQQLPEELRELTRQRMAPLGPDTRRVLAVAATIGQDFDVALLQAALGLSAERLLERLTIAVRAGFVRESSDGTGRFAFVHALVRETLYHDLPAPKRAELHREIGRALEAQWAEAPAARGPVAELAHHYAHAACLGEARKAIEYALAAGDRAITSLAYEEALAQYARALDLLSLETPDAALELRARLGLGDAAWRSGDQARARNEFQRAGEAAQAGGDAESLARAAIGFSEAAPQTGVADAALVRLLEAALAALRDDDSVLRARVLAGLAEALYGVPGEEERRERMSREAVAMARRLGDGVALASALNARHFTRGDSLDERLAMAAESGRLARGLQGQGRSLDAVAWLIGDLLELGNVAAADRELETLARAADEFRMPFYRWVVTTTRAGRALLAGRYVEGARLAAEARAIVPEGDPTSFVQQVHAVQLAIVNEEKDRLGDSEPALALLASRIPSVAGWRCSLAALLMDLGREAEARSLLEQLAAEDFAELPRDTGFSGALAMLARVVTALGDLPRARVVYDLLLPYAERNVVVGFGIACYGAAARYLAMLAVSLGLAAEAERHFEQALELNARTGARPYLAHTQHEYTRFLLARRLPGDAARAAGLRAEAQRTAGELGMERLGRLLAATGTPGPGAADGSTSGVLARSGDAWTVMFAGNAVRLSDTKGVRYLAALLRCPGEELHVLRLGDAPYDADVRAAETPGGSDAGLRAVDLGDAGELLDAEARSAYRARLAALREERAEAERFNDRGRVELAERETEMITRELARAVGLGGRARRAGSVTERARLNVTRAIAAVLRKIAAEHPALAEHFAGTIHLGTYCSYTPDPRNPVHWEL